LSDWATVIDAPLVEHRIGAETWKWYSLDGFPHVGIDMLVVDGPPEPFGKMIRYPAGPMLFPKLMPRGAILIDDAARTSEMEIVERWRWENPRLVVKTYDCEKGCLGLELDKQLIK